MLQVGSIVGVAKLPPWVSELPVESQRVFAFCLGRAFKIVAIDEQGLFVLDVSHEVDRQFGGFLNDLRLEGEYLQDS